MSYTPISPLDLARRYWRAQELADLVRESGTLGNAAPIVGAGVQAAGATSIALASHGILFSTAAIPVIGVAMAGVTLALTALFSRKGPAQKVASTKIVNDLEPLLQQNLAAYMAGPRTVESQAQALKNFDDSWAYLNSSAGCGNPELGNPGRACLEDRSRTGRWPWEAWYRDPIANDPQPAQLTAQEPAAVQSITATAQSVFQTAAENPLMLAGLAGLVLFFLLPRRHSERY